MISRLTSRGLTTKMLRYPAAERNREAILQALKAILTNDGKIHDPMKALEIGSGSGQHISYLAQSLPHIEWQPSEVDNRLFVSIESYAKSMALRNVLPPIGLDVSAPVHQWPIPETITFDLIFCANVIHISPWRCTEGLFRGSGHFLANTGLLVTYGPYAWDGVLTPQSNVDFDLNLRYQNPEWGVRDVADLKRLAQINGLSLISSYDMPANNKVLVFKKV